jgi:SAM-dependent methyltransferase
MAYSRFLKGVTVGMTSGRQLVLAGVFCFVASVAMGQTAAQAPFEPKVGQPGKDVVWVPTPDALVQRMLDIAKVTPDDYLIDLGSGDGRTVIAAAKRGLRAHGIEFNPDMVKLAQAAARREGVTERATFEQADLFTKLAELRKADVITMFLLSSINLRLRPELLELEPGTRIVSNTFRMSDWEPDQTSRLEGDCVSWCEALLWIVPAKVDGAWQVGNETLTLKQEFQRFQGTLGARAIEDGRLNGREVTFTVGTARYTGQVQGDAIAGTVSTGGTFSARRAAR